MGTPRKSATTGFGQSGRRDVGNGLPPADSAKGRLGNTMSTIVATGSSCKKDDSREMHHRGIHAHGAQYGCDAARFDLLEVEDAWAPMLERVSDAVRWASERGRASLVGVSAVMVREAHGSRCGGRERWCWGGQRRRGD